MKPEDVDNDKLLERAKLLACKGVGEPDPAKLRFLIELGVDQVDPTDAHILIDGIYGVYWNSDIITVIPSINNKGDKRQQFGVFRIDHDPGVMYHRDGSGTPPSEDWVDIGELHSTFEDAFIEAFKLAVGHGIMEFLTYEDENKLADEVEAADEFD